MATTKLPRIRKKAPCDAEWNRVKDKFERLYIREGLTLSEISAVLARDDNFHAAPHMYKHRIKQWSMKKNFKIEELGAVAKTLAPFVQAGLNTPTAVIDKRQVPIDRAKRHFRASFQKVNLRRSWQSVSAPKLADCGSPGPEAKKKQQRHSPNIPKILLQQSGELHDLESALVQVNNYYIWRLTQSDDYFLVQILAAGENAAVSDALDPQIVIIDMITGLGAFDDGGYHVAQASIRQISTQASTLLLQQHPSLIENLICGGIGNFGADGHRLQSSIFSYLLKIASRLLGYDHPIPMVLKLLQCPETQRTAPQLVLKLMWEITQRQEESCPETVFELEYYMVEASISYDDFHTSLELCRTLLQRYVGNFGERHKFCRRLLKMLGHLYYRHSFDEEAEENLLRVLELDDSYAQDVRQADSVSCVAMRLLGWIREDRAEFSEAEKWYSQSYEAACNIWGLEDISSQRHLHDLNQARRKLSQTEDISELDQANSAAILEELEMQMEQMDLGEMENVANLEGRAEPWNERDGDIQNTSIPGHTATNGSIQRNSASVTNSPAEDHQSPRRVESREFIIGISSVMEINPAVMDDTSVEPQYPKTNVTMPLGCPFTDTSFDDVGEEAMLLDELSFATANHWCDRAATEINATVQPEESAPPNIQDSTRADPYVENLPVLNDDPEFQKFDNVGNVGDKLYFDPMILDADSDFSMADYGFFDSSDLQDRYALEGQDGAKNQELQDIEWGDIDALAQGLENEQLVGEDLLA